MPPAQGFLWTIGLHTSNSPLPLYLTVTATITPYRGKKTDAQ